MSTKRPRQSAHLLIAVMSAALWPCAAQALIYGNGADANEPLVLSNHASEATPLLLLAEPAGSAAAAPMPAAASAPQAPAAAPAAAPVTTPVAAAATLRVPSVSLASLIARIAREHAVPASLVQAVVAAESGFDRRAVSPKGAKGLMQLMPDTARRFGVRDVFSDEQNLRGGTAYLRWLLDFFAGDVQLALAGFNAGEGAVLRAGRRVPDFAETRGYVPKVLAYQAHYARQAR